MRIRIKQSKNSIVDIKNFLHNILAEIEQGKTSGDGWKLLSDDIMTAINMDKGMAEQIAILYNFCKKRQIIEFKTSQVKNLLSHSQYARTGDLVYFGRLVTKVKKGRYQLDMQRCLDFIENRLQIPTRVWKNDETGKVQDGGDRYKLAQEMTYLSLDEDGNYVPQKEKQSNLFL